MSIGAKISGKKKTKTITRVPATLKSGDIRPVAIRYRDLAQKFLESEPGITEREKGLYKREAAETIAGTGKGERLRGASRARRYGYRGALEEDIFARIRQDEMREQRMASIQLSLAEHAIREDDIVRRAAVAAQFVWPAEAARGAGQVSKIEGQEIGATVSYQKG